MQIIKTFVVSNFKEFKSNPLEKTINFAAGMLGSAAIIWFLSVVCSISLRIIISSYQSLTGSF